MLKIETGEARKVRGGAASDVPLDAQPHLLRHPERVERPGLRPQRLRERRMRGYKGFPLVMDFP